MTGSGELLLWPYPDEPGEFTAACSCGEWSITGTAKEITDAARLHNDGLEWNNHIVTVRSRRRKAPK